MTKDEALQMAIEVIEAFGRGCDIDDYFMDVSEAIKACKEALNTKQPTRLEIIDAAGRTYTNWKVKEMEFSYQDDGRTLKIFIKEKNG
jgi:hypothetical protein